MTSRARTQQPLDENGNPVNPANLFTLFTLAESFAAGANAARTASDIDAWIRGQLSSHTQEIDGKVVDGNRNQLFGIGGVVDLESFDIQRGRDHGVGNYNVLEKVSASRSTLRSNSSGPPTTSMLHG